MRIAIIGAMVSEVELLRERIDGRTTSAHAGKEFYTGTLGGADVVLTACGVGKVAAASRTQAMIDIFSPDRIIFTGIAGALDPRIEIGDIVVSTDCVQSDVNVGVFDYPLGLVPGFDKVGFDADPAMRRLALFTIPPSDMTAISVVPPPISTTIEPVGSVTGKSAPIAAAMGSSMR